MAATITPEIIDQFVDKVVIEPGGCWGWHSHHNQHGYGTFKFDDGGQWTAESTHRFAYRWLVGPIAEGKVLDHLCRNRGCCNPTHLEAVSQAENLERGHRVGGQGRFTTHCVNGHEFTPENTYVRVNGRRSCRQCKRDSDKRVYYADIEASRAKGRADYYKRRARGSKS